MIPKETVTRNVEQLFRIYASAGRNGSCEGGEAARAEYGWEDGWGVEIALFPPFHRSDP